MNLNELQLMNVRELRQLCRDRKLSGYSSVVKQGKDALVAWMSVQLAPPMSAVRVTIDRLRELLAQRGASEWVRLRLWLLERFALAAWA